ncbi:MAG: 4Fe-4S dicluster domain-containing protein [Anaerolineae bacterium]|nr:4Fe-4S dicluster domain-containing protein [Anaerolineae bacterium]
MAAHSKEISNEKLPPLSRRDFLKLLGIAGVSTAVAKVVVDSPLFPYHSVVAAPGARPSLHSWAMVIDLENCIGCDRCTYACQATNNLPDDIHWNVVTPEVTSMGKEYFLPRPCLHCENPPCTDVCPVGATYKREDGLVVMDYDKCIGCRYCQVACPYGARSFNWSPPEPGSYSPEYGDPEVEQRPRGVVEKCTFCIHRIDAGLAVGLTPGEDVEATPACCNACPAEARFFGDLNNPNSRVSRLIAERAYVRLRDELGTASRVYYLLPQGGL